MNGLSWTCRYPSESRKAIELHVKERGHPENLILIVSAYMCDSVYGKSLSDWHLSHHTLDMNASCLDNWVTGQGLWTSCDQVKGQMGCSVRVPPKQRVCHPPSRRPSLSICYKLILFLLWPVHACQSIWSCRGRKGKVHGPGRAERQWVNKRWHTTTSRKEEQRIVDAES